MNPVCSRTSNISISFVSSEKCTICKRKISENGCKPQFCYFALYIFPVSDTFHTYHLSGSEDEEKKEKGKKDPDLFQLVVVNSYGSGSAETEG